MNAMKQPAMTSTQTRRKGINGRAKGKRAEKDIAEKLSEWLGLPPSEFVRARSGSKEPDVAFSQAAAERFPYHCEVKARAKLDLASWVAQAVQDSKLVSDGREPIVIYKYERKIKVVTRFLHFCDLLGAYGRPGIFAAGEFPAIEELKYGTSDIWIVLGFDYFMELATGHLRE